VHFTPTSASWINLVERFFALLTEKQIRRGIHRSTRELEQAIQHYLDIYNGPILSANLSYRTLVSCNRNK
jgi:hypothetical protein